MLSRRDALLTSAAFLVGANRTLQANASFSEFPIDKDSSAAKSRMELAVAEACRQSAAACSLIICSRANQAFSFEFTSLCTDSRDICAVTAQVLSCPGAKSPALCQACADACDRVAKACRSTRVSRDIQNCETAAETCAAACRTRILESLPV